jgi:hypothetical protein
MIPRRGPGKEGNGRCRTPVMGRRARPHAHEPGLAQSFRFRLVTTAPNANAASVPGAGMPAMIGTPGSVS